MSEKLVIIAGPTASGKSNLALSVAERFDGEIVNADSMQVYRELRVITARPSVEDEARAPHHLYGFLPGGERFSAARWCELAKPCIKDIWGRGRMPILVGGTGLYIRALLEGLAPVPEIPAAIRTRAARLMNEHGALYLHNELERIDRETAARLAPNDRQRILRAWEVVTATGRSLSAWHRDPREGGIAELGSDIRINRFVLDPPRDWLYARCDARLKVMLQSGGKQELAALAKLKLDPGLPVMKALGVHQLLPWIRGEEALGEALVAAQTATRRYVKRQMTWFRNQFSDWTVLREQQSEKKINEVFSFIRQS
ncbi:MAG: tRNA (adenosine(37)-N6)-dimethylallyltransferase MiaA [Sphingomonadales bacterium]